MYNVKLLSKFPPFSPINLQKTGFIPQIEKSWTSFKRYHLIKFYSSINGTPANGA